MCCNVGFAARGFGQGSSANVTNDFSACAAENDLFVFAIIAFHAQESAFGFVRIIRHGQSLRKFEFFRSKAGSLMRFFTDGASVFERNLFGRFVAAGNLREFTCVTDTGLSFLLSGNHGQRGGFAFFHSFQFNIRVLFAERAISFNGLWHLHDVSPAFPD